MKKLLLLIIVISAFASCSPQAKLNKLIRKHPELFKRDSVVVRDTVVLAGVKKDTVFTHVISKDTLLIREKQLEIKYYNDGKTVYLQGKCDTVFQVREVKVPQYTVEYVERFPLKQLIIVLAIFLLGLLFFKNK